MKYATTVWFAFFAGCLVLKHSRVKNEWMAKKKKFNKGLSKYHGHISLWFHCFNLLNMFTWFSPIVFVLDSLSLFVQYKLVEIIYEMCECMCALRRKLQVEKKGKKKEFVHLCNKNKNKMKTTIAIKGARGSVTIKVVCEHWWKHEILVVFRRLGCIFSRSTAYLFWRIISHALEKTRTKLTW